MVGRSVARGGWVAGSSGTISAFNKVEVDLKLKLSFAKNLTWKVFSINVHVQSIISLYFSFVVFIFGWPLK